LGRAHELWHAGEWQSPCWISPVTPDGVESQAWLPPGKARTRLGQEHDLIIFDALDASAFDADAFGALSGTLRAGGLLVLLTPLAQSDVTAIPVSRYLARLLQQLAGAPGVACWHAGEELQLPVLSEPPGYANARFAGSNDEDCLTADQAEAVARLVRLRRRRPLVLTADRGRGKTAALGIACARLLAAGQAHIQVTAPRPEAIATLFERLTALRPEGQRQDNRFVEAGVGCVEFMAPDMLSDQVTRGEAGGPGSWLLVDEAAAIPAAMLGAWLVAFPRIVFATTVHGYEGSGRGFALRFRERLERETPAWQQYHLAAPIRWSTDDPLEPLINQLLLLDAEPPVAVPLAPVVLQQWQQAQLVADEQTLRAVFGLLVQAHYRTTPGDLQRLLDERGLSITTLTSDGQVQAVCVSANEGGFAPELAERVARGERRLPGHLLAQSLAAHAGSRQALTAHLRRVQRIAVHPERRREGLGRHLLEAERQATREAGIDLLGASFGAEPGLLAFWQALGFCTVRLGLSRETSTGEHAVMVAAPLSAEGSAISTGLVGRFRSLLPALLAFELAALDPEVVLALLREGGSPPRVEDERQDLADVAGAGREPALARPALQALVWRAAQAPPHDPELAWLAGWAFQGRDLAWLGAQAGVTGRRQALAKLREIVGRYLSVEENGKVVGFPPR